MTPNPTNWLPGVIVLVGGLVLAALYLLASRQKGKPAATVTDGTLDDLDRRAQELIEQLKELNAEKHLHAPEHFQAEKTRLELAAAAALRARDEHAQGLTKKAHKAAASGKKAQVAAAEAPQGFFARNPKLVGAAWGGGVSLFMAVMWIVLSQNQQPRVDGAPSTGRVPPGAESSNPSSGSGPFEAALAEVNANPENVEAAAMVAHELLRMQRFDQANAITERALGVDPFHMENRVHRGLLAAVKGDVQGSMEQLQHLADTYPDAQEALLFLGSIAGQHGDLRRALECFERFAAEAPPEDQPPQLAEGIAQLRRQLGVGTK